MASFLRAGRVSGHRDDYRVREARERPDAARHLATVAVGQSDVQENGLGLELGNRGDSVHAGALEPHRMTGASKQNGKLVADIDVVLDRQNAERADGAV